MTATASGSGAQALDERPPTERARLVGMTAGGGVSEIHYTKTADGYDIAYQVMGDGPLDVVWVPGLAGHLELEWEAPIALVYRRLASFARLIRFDKRGVGLSDRNVGAPTLEERIDDVRAVMDAVGSEQAALIGVSEGGPMSILFAATYPQRTVALVLYGTMARPRPDVDYPIGNEESMAALLRIMEESWGTGESLTVFASPLAQHGPSRELMGRLERAMGNPSTLRAMAATLVDIDVRAVVPTITVPTLVIHATDDRCVPLTNGRWLADHILGARMVEIAGEHVVFDYERFADEVESFLTGRRQGSTTDRVLLTVMFSDIVGSTERAATLGDRSWKQLLDHHDAVVQREVTSHRGAIVKMTGDGVLATFDGPARAVRCAQTICSAVRPLGIEVRAGVHTGEVELRGHDIGGIAVHIGQRVSAIADANEVLVSRTVADLVVGSGIEFEDEGEHELKGVPGHWQLYAVKG